MDQVTLKSTRRSRRRRGLRARIRGTPERPRLSVFRSHKHIYAQIIDDLSGRTLAAASTKEGGLSVRAGGNREAAVAVGKVLAQRATEAGIGAVVFDRGGYRYHGRVKSLADAAREAGLKF
jgi:large subunit ribosomal protein L18